METITATDAERHFAPAPPAHPRRAIGATIVAGIYVLLVLGAPAIVRYAPDPDTFVAAEGDLEAPAARCASAPEFGYSCRDDEAIATPRPRLVFAAH
jgi:hypothetical protein